MSGPKPVITPRACSLSRRACTVPRATRRRRDSSSTPSRGAAASSAMSRRSTSSTLMLDSLPSRRRITLGNLPSPAGASVDVRRASVVRWSGMSTTDRCRIDTAPAAHLARLGLHRVLGRQRPGLRRLPHGRPSASAAPPTPAPRPGCGTRPATCSSRATSASSCRGALTADSPIAAHVRTHGDGVHDLAWLVDDATRRLRRGHRPRRRAGPGAVDRDRRRRHAASWPRSRPTARPATRSCPGSDYHGRLLEPGYATENLPPEPVGPDGRPHPHRPRRRQRRAGQARRLGALLRARSSASGSSSTSTTTRSPPSTRR